MLSTPVFYGTRPEDDPFGYLDETEKTLRVMNATDKEAVEFASYQLKGVAYTWYETCVRERGENAPLATWKEFSMGFMEQFLSDADRYSLATLFEQLK